MIADLAGAVATAAPESSDPTPALVLTLLVCLGLAVVAVRGVVARAGAARWAYLAGLVVGGALGLWAAAESDGLLSPGLAIGLGASAVGVPVLEAVTARLKGSREPAPPHDPEDP